MLSRLTSADRDALSIGGIVLAIVLFLSVNFLAGTLLRSVRLDLTAESLFTLAEGTKQVLAAVDEPIVLRFYRSERLGDLGPLYEAHAKRVADLLDEYVRLSGGRLIIERYDPQPFSPEEDLAVADGVRGITIDTDGTQVYFGLAGTNSTDDREAIPFVAPENANFLEYDLTRMVHALANPEKPVVAVLGDLPLRGNQFNRFQPWLVFDFMEQFFDVRAQHGTPSQIDDDVEVLLLAQPASLETQTLYAIDQFVMRGGRVLAFVDPLAEVLAGRGPGQQQPPGDAVAALEPLLAAWGIEIPNDKVIGDRRAAVRVQARHQGRDVVTDYLPWIGLSPSSFADDDVVTGSLRQLNLRTAGSIRARDGAATTIEPLIVSSPAAMEIDAEQLRFAPDPVALLSSFAPAGAPFTLAARVSGPVESAFPDGPPEAVEDEEIRGRHRADAEAPLNLIVVADADLLADGAWAQRGSLLGQQFTVPTANNGDFAINALDNLSGSAGLISLRGRGLSNRPFEVLEDMARSAEDRFRATEQELLAKIEETREKIRKLQEDETEGGVILTAAQQTAIDEFRGEMLALRQDLRDVQFALLKDVDALETWLRVINIWTVPVLVAILACGLALLRRRRAARHRAAEAG